MAQLIENELHALAEQRRDRERTEASRIATAATHETRTRERFVEVCRSEVLPALAQLASAFQTNEPEVHVEIVDRLELADPSVEVRLRWLGSHRSSTTLDLMWNRDTAEVSIVGSGLRAREVVDCSLDDLSAEFVRERFAMAARSMLCD